MPNGYLIFAGPQAAGKSTIINYIFCKYQSLVSSESAQEFGTRIPSPSPKGKGNLPTNLVKFLEMRKIVLDAMMIPGGLYVDWATEAEIIERDLRRMDEMIARSDNRVYVDETNIFTLAHAMNHGIDVPKYRDEYMQRLRQLNPLIIFLDVDPNISWQRRKSAYDARVTDFPASEKAAALINYRTYLNKVHSELHNIYDTLQIPKVMFDTNNPLEDVLEKVSREIFDAATKNNICLVNRTNGYSSHK